MGYPRLADRFFLEKRPTHEFFCAWKEAGAWSPQLLPVYEWQGILYVSISSVENVRVDGDWCLVQGNPELMEELWNEWQLAEHSAPTEELQDPTSDTNEAVELETQVSHGESDEPAPSLQPSEPESQFDFVNVEQHDQQDLGSPPQFQNLDLNPDALIELHADPSIKLSDESVVHDSASKVTELELLQLGSEVELRSNNQNIGDAKSAVISLSDLIVAAPTPSGVLPPIPGSTFGAPLDLPSVRMPALPSSSMPPTAPPRAVPPIENPEESALEEDESTFAPVTSISVISHSPTRSSSPPSPRPASNGVAASATPVSKSTPSAQKSGGPDDLEIIWKKLGSHFDHVMVLTFKDGFAIPWRWDPKLMPKAQSEPLQKFTLAKASPFRIVARTQKSYHGLLVPNEVSDLFFQTWNQGSYPEHLSIAPILDGEVTTGFLMAWGNQAANTKECLQLIEASAFFLHEKIQERTSQLKTA